MTDILNPIDIINELFGNLYFFFGVALIGYFYIAAKNNWNLQLTILGAVASFFFISAVQVGFAIWIAVIILFLSFAISYIVWSFIKTR